MIFTDAVEDIRKDIFNEVERAKLTLFIAQNQEFLKRVFEDTSIEGIPVRLGDDIENFDTYALQVVEKFREVKSRALTTLP